jgi:hypothetical protein
MLDSLELFSVDDELKSNMNFIELDGRGCTIPI